MIKHYSVLISKIVNEVLNFCKNHQKGRLTSKVNALTFDFSLNWFINSGLYDLWSKYIIYINKKIPT
ncbi:hypothetical protein LCGC14_0540360 [marine sediment metagenome]|uniref:Uncharacterized protein n=1 Tax=marine sediment metagenome TaxID=412755 RepID=A0A0F9RXR9_9ZZZZ